MLLAQVAQFDGGFGLAVLRAVALLLALLDQAGQRLTVGQNGSASFACGSCSAPARWS